jgi:uncharacterized SAM-binding protein YcdF (DUF218 family)
LLLSAALATTAYFATLGVAIYWQGTRDERRPSDAILVLGAAQWNGAPSPVLRGRLDHAITLYHEGYAPRVIVTGGVGDGDVVSEADVAAVYLVQNGVPEAAILSEDRGRSSIESLRGAATISHALGLSDLLLVSDPPHMLRALRLADAVGLRAHPSPAQASSAVAGPISRVRFLLREILVVHGYQWGAILTGARH